MGTTWTTVATSVSRCETRSMSGFFGNVSLNVVATVGGHVPRIAYDRDLRLIKQASRVFGGTIPDVGLGTRYGARRDDCESNYPRDHHGDENGRSDPARPRAGLLTPAEPPSAKPVMPAPTRTTFWRGSGLPRHGALTLPCGAIFSRGQRPATVLVVESRE